MNKQAFLTLLRDALRGLPQDELEERLAFYAEMIDDRTEDGMTEEDAVKALGSVEEVTSQIVADIPLAKIAKETFAPKRRLKTWEIVLLAVSSPLWLSLGLAAIAVTLALYVSVWAVIVSLFAVFGAFVGCSLGGFAVGAVMIAGGGTLAGIAVIGAAIVLAGLSVFMFIGSKASVKGVILLTKKAVLSMKNVCIKKGDAV